MKATHDTALVSAAVAGDTTAFGELFERYQTRIYNYAYGIVGNPDDARDVAQDAFLKVFEKLPEKGADLAFSAYLYRTAHNLAIDVVRPQKRYAAPEALDYEMEPALRADPERVSLVAEQQATVRAAAAMLPDKQREILELRELHDMSYDEIAGVMEMPRNTVGVLLSRARLKFKGAFRMASVKTDGLAKECEDILPLLSALIDDELSDTERERVEAHLEECPLCNLALEEMREASKSYRGLIPLIPPAAMHADVMRGLEELLRHSVAPPGDAGGTPAEASAQTGTGGQVANAPSEGVTAGQGAPAVAARGIPTALKVAGGAVAAALSVFAMVVGYAVVGPALAPDSPRSLSLSGLASDAPTVSAADAVTGTLAEVEPRREDDGTGPEDGSSPAATGDTQAPPTPEQLKPLDGQEIVEYETTLRWSAVEDESGVSYGVEVQRFDGSRYEAEKYADGLSSTAFALTLVGQPSLRWRVWAVDGAGNASARSPWRTINPPTVTIIPPTEIYVPPTLY